MQNQNTIKYVTVQERSRLKSACQLQLIGFVELSDIGFLFSTMIETSSKLNYTIQSDPKNSVSQSICEQKDLEAILKIFVEQIKIEFLTRF